MRSVVERAPEVPAGCGGIEERLCRGCGRCVAACRKKVLTLEAAGEMGMGKKTARVVGEGGCQRCGRCVEACPYGAIRKQT